jgi:hypothetical protein
MGRALGIADGQLYYSSGSGTAGIYALGNGLPQQPTPCSEAWP